VVGSSVARRLETVAAKGLIGVDTPSSRAAPAPAPAGASAVMPPAVSSTMGASACSASSSRPAQPVASDGSTSNELRSLSRQEVGSTLVSAAASNAPSLDESLPAYRILAAMASHSGSVLDDGREVGQARGRTGWCWGAPLRSASPSLAHCSPMWAQGVATGS